jgi:DNA-binding Lrp family transcriptional regulator
LIPFDARLANWLSVGFILDIADLGRLDAPLLDALLVAAIIEANVARLNGQPALQSAYALLDNAPPDELRRPVSINALAASLGIPFETVRRHVNRLISQGFIATAPGGIYVPTSVLVSPQFVTAAVDRYRRVRRFYEDLVAGGAIEAMPAPPPPAGHPQAPIRAVGRILGDYFFRTMSSLHQIVPDPLTGLLLLDVIRASTEHVPSGQAAGAMRQGWISDAERTPAPVAQLARRLGIPYETARRRVGSLVEQGFCRRERGGVLLASAYRESAAVQCMTSDNLINVRRMFRQVAAVLAGEGEASAEAAARL